MENTFLFIEQLGNLYYEEVYFLYDEPQLFTVNNAAGQKFLSVLSEADEYHLWYLVAISDASLALLKCNKIDINSIFTTPELGYVWKVTEDSNKIVEVKPVKPESILSDDLPVAGYYLNYSGENALLPSFIDDIQEDSLKEKRDIFDIAFEINDTHVREIGCDFLGQVLQHTQSVIYALAFETDQISGPIPKQIKDHCELQVSGTFAASFGVRMKSDDLVNLERKTAVTDILRDFLALLNIKNNREELHDFLESKPRRVVPKYRAFMKSLAVANAGINVKCASPNNIFHQIKYTSSDVLANLSLLDQEIKSITDVLRHNGQLVAANVVNLSFVFISHDNEIIKGKIDKSLKNVVFEVPKYATIKIERSIDTNSFTNEEKYEYRLLEYSPINAQG